MEDDEFDLRLKCDVEFDLGAPNDATLNKWAADTLRKLADRLEKDEFESGHHPVADSVGKRIGTIYVDYYGESA